MAGNYIEYYTAMQKVVAKYDDFAKVASGKSLKEQLDIIKEYPKALSSLNNELPFMGGYRDDIFQLRKAWENSKRVFSESVETFIWASNCPSVASLNFFCKSDKL